VETSVCNFYIQYSPILARHLGKHWHHSSKCWWPWCDKGSISLDKTLRTDSMYSDWYYVYQVEASYVARSRYFTLNNAHRFPQALPNLCCDYWLLRWKASNVLARVQTFSSYKHHNTVKNTYLESHHREQYASYPMVGVDVSAINTWLRTVVCWIINLDSWRNYFSWSWIQHWRFSRNLLCTSVHSSITKGKKQVTRIDVEQTRRIAKLVPSVRSIYLFKWHTTYWFYYTQWR
jgi:hypothetical protein